MSSKLSPGLSRIVQSRPLGDDEAKWVSLRAVEWIDPSGKHRQWESADRRTRKGDTDAVAILTVIKRPSTPPHTLLVSQFRPPVGQVVIELPAGLIDAGEEGEEGAKRAALRELAEETGYSSEAQGATVSVRSISDIIHNDPGLTGANMKLCIIDIALEDDAPEPVSQPDEGEYIDLHLVPLHSLQSHLQDFAHKGFAIDARLSHLAAGLALAAQLA